MYVNVIVQLQLTNTMNVCKMYSGWGNWEQDFVKINFQEIPKNISLEIHEKFSGLGH